MTTHTPGPWTVQLPPNEARIRVVDHRALQFDNSWIADLMYWSSSSERGPMREEALANAKLIAAAPDLLAFAMRVCNGEGDSIRTLIEQGKAAIEKATK